MTAPDAADPGPDAGPGPSAWLTLPEAAHALDVPEGRVRQLVRERQLPAQRLTGEGLRVPADVLLDGAVVRGLPGLLTVLADGGYTDDEALRWLYTPDPSLPGGTPIEALRAGRSVEVKRRAQALAF